MFDRDEAGTEGAKEALWFFAERQLDVRLACSPTMFEGTYHGKQLDSLCQSDAEALLTR